MARLFELQWHEADGDILAIVDLDKVCLVRIEKNPGHHYERLRVQFVGGHEANGLVPPEAVKQFLDAYREYLREQSAKRP